MHALQCLAITGYHTPQCEPQRRSGNAQTRTTTHYQHRARYAWQALLQSKVKFDPHVFRFAKINYAELAYELRVWPFVYNTRRAWVRVTPRALSSIFAKRKTWVSPKTHTEFIFSQEIRSELKRAKTPKMSKTRFLSFFGSSRAIRTCTTRIYV